MLHRFGRQIPQNGPITLVQYLVGISIEGMASALPVGGNPEHPLTEQQIWRLLAGLDALPPRASIANAYEGERFSGLSAVQHVIVGVEPSESLAVASFAGRTNDVCARKGAGDCVADRGRSPRLS